MKTKKTYHIDYVGLEKLAKRICKKMNTLKKNMSEPRLITKEEKEYLVFSEDDRRHLEREMDALEKWLRKNNC